MAIQVFAGGGVGNLQEKTIMPSTTNITVVADEGYDALSKVTVFGDENLKSENIKNGVSIWGVTGTSAYSFYKILEMAPTVSSASGGNYLYTFSIPLDDFGDISESASAICIQPLSASSGNYKTDFFVAMAKLDNSWFLYCNNLGSSSFLYSVSISDTSFDFTIASLALYYPRKGMYAVYIETS